jgi:hypothetical protein
MEASDQLHYFGAFTEFSPKPEPRMPGLGPPDQVKAPYAIIVLAAGSEMARGVIRSGPARTGKLIALNFSSI